MDALWEDDVEHLGVEQTVAAMHPRRDAGVLAIVEQMRRWKLNFTRAVVRDEESEMACFWLRKTRQPVLAVQNPQGLTLRKLVEENQVLANSLVPKLCILLA